MSRVMPWVVAGVCLLAVAGAAMRPSKSPGRVDLTEFRRVAVVERGRIKPIDSVARTTLRIISNRETIEDPNGDDRTSLEWFMAVASQPGPIAERPVAKWKVFYIENDQVLSALDLKARKGFLYALTEFAAKEPKIQSEVERIGKLQDKGIELELYEQKMLRLNESYQEFLKIALHKSPLIVPPTVVPPQSVEEDWQPYSSPKERIFGRLPEEMQEELYGEAAKAVLMRHRIDQNQIRALGEARRRQLLGEINAAVMAEIEAAMEVETPTTPLQLAVAEELKKVPSAKAWAKLLRTYRDGKPSHFREALTEYEDSQTTVAAKDVRVAKFETWYNRSALFYWCNGLYVLAGLFACLGFLTLPQHFRRYSTALIVAALFVHTAGLLARMYISGRPPVTNLYSSAFFIGWGCVILGLILERIWPLGIGNLTAAALGFGTCVIGYNLGIDRDTLENMQAVLDTNFWLSTHVTIVTLGYTSTFVAGFLGLIFIVRGLFTKSLDDKSFKDMGQMIYGVVCFATLLSFVGTVLGGIWADFSWGRFWGWDSKENGAVLVVLWNALLLHARWGGLVQQRGMAILAVGGAVVMSWSWFGTNMLGVGLHSYGFLDRALPVLVRFWFVSIGVMIVAAAIPARHWMSYGGRYDAPPPSRPGKGHRPEMAAS